VAALTLTVLGCGGDDAGGSNEVPSPTVTIAAPVTPTGAPVTTETPVVGDELALIHHQAAVDWVDGVLVPKSSDCATSDRSCVEALRGLPASASEGMVRLIGADPRGAGAGWIILGKRTDGSWGVFV
jgi:hypothetical protein